MDPTTRNVVIGVGAAVALVVAGAIGFAIGRSGEEQAAPTRSAAPTIAVPSDTAAASTASPTSLPAISSAGQILGSGDDAVTPGAATLPCASLVSPGIAGECGEVVVLGQRIVWVVESRPVAGGGTGFAARILTHSVEDGGWVERLAADDPQGQEWSDVTVLAADLTADGVPELLAGFRRLGERQVLEYDIVSYGQDGVPEVLAHPGPSNRGSVVVGPGEIQEYSGQYADADPACCPSAFEHRTIVFDAGAFRINATEVVAVGAVPASQL